MSLAIPMLTKTPASHISTTFTKPGLVDVISGFSSVAQFCTKYREIMGVSPKQMKKKMLENEQTIEKDKYSN